MTKEEKIEALRDELRSTLFTTSVEEIEKIDAILEEMDKLEPFTAFDVEESLRSFKEKYRYLFE